MRAVSIYITNSSDEFSWGNDESVWGNLSIFGCPKLTADLNSVISSTECRSLLCYFIRQCVLQYKMNICIVGKIKKKCVMNSLMLFPNWYFKGIFLKTF